MDIKLIKNVKDGKERAFYHVERTRFENITIDGIEDGESSFKECRYIEVVDSYFNLRYPFWHDYDITIKRSKFCENARAAFWYCYDVVLIDVVSDGIKALRECNDIMIKNCIFNSPEFGWRNKDISIFNSKINAEYGFFECQNLSIENLEYTGKYSFQYVENAIIIDSNLDTKDAFWHAKDVTVRNTILKGEYLGWYSSGLTLINCTIIGTQPLCYCKNLTLVDCRFIDCDLAFEYSEVNGNIIGEIDSIKNPISGHLIVDKINSFIEDENSKKTNFLLEVNNI